MAITALTSSYVYAVPSTAALSPTVVVQNYITSTSMSSVCPIAFSLMLDSSTSATGAFLTIDSSNGAITVDTNIVSSKNVFVRYVYDLVSTDTSYFIIKCDCG